MKMVENAPKEVRLQAQLGTRLASILKQDKKAKKKDKERKKSESYKRKLAEAQVSARQKLHQQQHNSTTLSAPVRSLPCSLLQTKIKSLEDQLTSLGGQLAVEKAWHRRCVLLMLCCCCGQTLMSQAHNVHLQNAGTTMHWRMQG
jgi:hypothetical protein